MKKTSDAATPWKSLRKPTRIGDIATKLVDGFSPDSDVVSCWALTFRRHCALYIEYKGEPEDRPMPSFRFLDIMSSRLGETGASFVLIELLDASMSDQFLKLCEDINRVLAGSKPENVHLLVRLRLERWKYLFRSGGSLSKEAQKGLYAELLFLKDFLLRKVAPLDAVRSWSGPLKAPRDFSLGSSFVEVKSNRGSQSPKVKISSEYQLASSPGEEVYLYVVSLNEGVEEGVSLRDMVGSVREDLAGDFIAEQELETRLASAGYSDEADYSDPKWVECGQVCYSVIEGFPRLDPSLLPEGVSATHYDLDLTGCEDYLVPAEAIWVSLGDDDDR